MFPPYKLFALIDVAKTFGVSARQVLTGTGLDLAMIEDPKTLTSVDQYVAACANTIKHCTDPRLPIRVGKSLHLSAYGLYGFALLCSPTVRDGFNIAVRYHRLATPIFSIDWRTADDHFIWYFPDEFEVRYAPPVRQFLLAQQVGQHITHIQDIARSDRRPLLIKIAHPAPPSAARYEEELGGPVVFSADASEIHFDQKLLEDRPPLTNPVTLAMLRESCEALIGRIDDNTSVAGRVTELIMERPDKFPSMETVANLMGMTPRTLRRRLADEGTSFSQVFDRVRRDLAEKYLSGSGFTVEDIADLLGFTDASNFRSSFRRWTGVAPSAFRQRATGARQSVR